MILILAPKSTTFLTFNRINHDQLIFQNKFRLSGRRTKYFSQPPVSPARDSVGKSNNNKQIVSSTFVGYEITYLKEFLQDSLPSDNIATAPKPPPHDQCIGKVLVLYMTVLNILDEDPYSYHPTTQPEPSLSITRPFPSSLLDTNAPILIFIFLQTSSQCVGVADVSCHRTSLCKATLSHQTL